MYHIKFFFEFKITPTFFHFCKKKICERKILTFMSKFITFSKHVQKWKTKTNQSINYINQ